MSNNLKLEVTRNAYLTVIDRRRYDIGEYISPHACRYNYRAGGEHFITLVISYTDKCFPKSIITVFFMTALLYNLYIVFRHLTTKPHSDVNCEDNRQLVKIDPHKR